MPETTVRMNSQFIYEARPGTTLTSDRKLRHTEMKWVSGQPELKCRQPASIYLRTRKHSRPRINPGTAAIKPNMFSFGPCLRPFSLVVPSAWKALPSLLHICSRVTSSESFCQTNQLIQHSFPFPALFIFSELDSVFLLCNYLFVLFFFCNVSSMRTDLVKLSVVPPELGHVERG